MTNTFGPQSGSKSVRQLIQRSSNGPNGIRRDMALPSPPPPRPPLESCVPAGQRPPGGGGVLESLVRYHSIIVSYPPFPDSTPPTAPENPTLRELGGALQSKPSSAMGQGRARAERRPGRGQTALLSGRSPGRGVPLDSSPVLHPPWAVGGECDVPNAKAGSKVQEWYGGGI